ncbi:nitroreductase family deazaflavin-dependent oxidoreductase [Agromyces intestinalis]|uniref:Nitroreductase family deazaflavin-dependent oxidoreductase n=1 Tax=Agromyces intestinalis TaxID=2592652 RepID=A0A5C1YG38_9MICO|nr:nitroreductase/quinone reductase family protein [Agromyces intestinalis]QEO15104.1 nitroreductase family deazaflavin-dependent oxidoreductase [Agromyces intestinalis]
MDEHRTAESTSTEPASSARIPPRWFVRTAWVVHRGLYRVSAGRFGLRPPQPGRWGMMHLTTVGRRSGRERPVIVAYFEDGPNLVTLAMNGWAAPEPAWWLNLQANPDATVVVDGGSRGVRARAAEGAERSRLWATWRTYGDDLDVHASLRPTETAVVVLEPRGGA